MSVSSEIFTRQLIVCDVDSASHTSEERDVGDLAREAGVADPRTRWPMSETPYVFLSHTGRDNVKEELARPTYWFLTEVVGVEAFLDDGSLLPGTQKALAILEPAYRCTHALVILSPTYRCRKYCVQELNTFIARNQEESFHIIPALWLLQKTEGYANVVKDLIWLSSTTSAAANFMINSLWPTLLRELQHQPMNNLAMEEELVRYVHLHRGRSRPIPPCLESFVSSSDIPREIISRRCWQLESMSDIGSDYSPGMRGHQSHSSSMSMLTLPGDVGGSMQETIRCRTVKQFWKLKSGQAPDGKLVKIECTLSTYAPFTVGAPWLKAEEHLELRQAMDEEDLEPNQEAKSNAMLAVTAGQMVMRTGELKGFGGFQYLGLYQAIVRNSIPLFVTKDYYDSHLFPMLQKHDVDGFEAIVVGKVIELPDDFCKAFADYMDTKEIKSEVVLDDNSNTLYALEVGDEGTSIEYIKQTPYLDGDIWVAVKTNGVTSFRSRFCNLADKEDLTVAIESLKKELDGQTVEFQFDQVDKRFPDAKDAMSLDSRNKRRTFRRKRDHEKLSVE